jgi:hypothetical protein
MHICFVSYWGLKEGLTQATVIPQLKILSEDERVDRISFVTIERKGGVPPFEMAKVEHYQLHTTESLRTKLFDRSRAKNLFEQLHRNHPVHLFIARGGLAAWLALEVSEQHEIDMAVESFEPHADYMLESGVWKRLDPRYVMTKSAEKRMMQVATFLLPVTRRYADHMVNMEEVDPEKVLVMPCCVDADQFAMRPSVREKRRADIGVSDDHVVGVYTGKLGGIYLDQEALVLFASARKYWRDCFHLIVLSPDWERWKERLHSVGFDDQSCTVRYVHMQEVPSYLSAADFAFSLHRPSPSKMGISPIKNAEYFANGLPVLLPEGIGDDSSEVEKWNLGVSFKLEEIDRQAMFNRITPMIEERETSRRIADWARERRSFEIVRKHYRTILNHAEGKS